MSDTATAPAARLTGAARESHRRAGARGRKRKQRAAEAERGRPALDALDRSIVDGLRTMLHATPEAERYRKPLDPEELILAVAEQLRHQSKRRRARGKTVVPYQREEVATAIADRLFRQAPVRDDTDPPVA